MEETQTQHQVRGRANASFRPKGFTVCFFLERLHCMLVERYFRMGQASSSPAAVVWWAGGVDGNTTMTIGGPILKPL